MTIYATPAYIADVVDSASWCVGRSCPRLRERYAVIITPKRWARLQAMFRCGYTAEAARYELGLAA